MNFVSQACLLRPSTLMTRNAFSCLRNVEAMSAFCKIKNWHVWRNIYQQQFARIQKFVLPIVYPYGLVPLHDSRGDAWVAPPACYNLRRPRFFHFSYKTNRFGSTFYPACLQMAGKKMSKVRTDRQLIFTTIQQISLIFCRIFYSNSYTLISLINFYHTLLRKISHIEILFSSQNMKKGSISKDFKTYLQLERCVVFLQ